MEAGVCLKSPAPLRLLIVADHPIERRSLALLLGTEPSFTVLAAAQHLEEAIAAAREHRPDVVLLATRLRGSVRIEEARRVLAEAPATRIVVLASSDCESMLFAALDAGASEYVLRSAEPEELFTALRRVHLGKPSLPQALRRRMAQRPRTLTAREMEVLDLMRRGLTDREIGIALAISPQTAKSHAKSIFAKLEAASRAEAVAEGFERGLLAVA